MDLLAKVFATALVFGQVATNPHDLKTSFGAIHDRSRVEHLLRAGCEHIRKAFDVESLNLDDLIETAMEDVDALSADQAGSMHSRPEKYSNSISTARRERPGNDLIYKIWNGIVVNVMRSMLSGNSDYGRAPG
jgi:hypothetical protein